MLFLDTIKSYFFPSTTKFIRNCGFWGSYFTPTNMNSQRENWFVKSQYIGEYWCALSNIGFIYVGLKHNSYPVLFAGIASFVSHSIPYQSLLYVDYIGVVAVGIMMAKKYDIIGLVVVNTLDKIISQKYGTCISHVFWHFYAAYVCDLILTMNI